MHGINNQYQQWYQRSYPRSQNCDTSGILIHGGYLKVRESLYARVIIWVNTILNHIDARAILPRCEGSCMIYKPKWY